MLYKMIFAYEIIAKDDIDMEEKYADELKEGLDLYNKHFPKLNNKYFHKYFSS